MSNHNNLLLKVECIHFFEENPYALETATSLASRLGRPVEHVEIALHELNLNSILSKYGEGTDAIYKYIEPIITKEKLEEQCNDL